jgi:Spy/CpxP family protein refolding chaperone
MSSKKIFGFAAMAVLAVGTLLAQAPGGSGPRAGRHGAGFARMKERIAQQLNLTEQQKQDAKAIFDQARESAKPVADQLRQNRQTMQEAVKAANEQRIEQIATEHGGLAGQLSLIHAKAFSRFYALLTPEQKAKADQMHQRVRERMTERFGKRG